jgi:RNA 2',3'-cyclic 3'-phosphodiesterase
VRLFLAVEPDRDVRAALIALIADARRLCGEDAAAFRWVGDDNIHITLHFLGEVDAARVPALREALGNTLAEPAFDITLGAPGAFPPHGPPRAIYVAVDAGSAALVRVHAELGRRLRAAGVAVESRPFTPHLTLARTRDRDRAGARRAVMRLMPGLKTGRSRWRVSAIALIESDLRGPRPLHTTIHEIALD